MCELRECESASERKEGEEGERGGFNEERAFGKWGEIPRQGFPPDAVSETTSSSKKEMEGPRTKSVDRSPASSC